MLSEGHRDSDQTMEYMRRFEATAKKDSEDWRVGGVRQGRGGLIRRGGVVDGEQRTDFEAGGREFVQTRNQMRRNEPSQLGDCDTPVTHGCAGLAPSQARLLHSLRMK